MLDPEYLDEAADLVGAVYTEIEDEMLRHLSRLLLSGADVLGQRGETALLLLAQTHAADLMAIVERHRGDASRAVGATVADAIARSDAADLAVLGDAAAPHAEGTLPIQAALTARGIAAILERDNVDMQAGALALWQSVVARAVTRVNTGAATTEAALHAAVREMMRAGISTVTYRDAETGRQTVTNRVDVAVRRHVRTQIQQDGLRRTMELCRASGCKLVEVSSHCGARPSHAEWQGRVYGLDGPCEVDGKSYRGLVDATGYGSVDGLGGANCRHSFGPWAPGTPRAYEPDPPHPSGLPNDEVYRLRQGQRRRERAIREAKRDLAGAQMVAGRDGSLANIAEVERAKARLAARQKGMRDFIAEANSKGSAPVLHRNPRREWAGDMPRVRKTDASRRTMGEFLDSDGVKRALKARGASKATAQKAVAEELKAQGLDARSWKYLSRTKQQSTFKRALARIESHVPNATDNRIRDLLGVPRFVSLDGMPASLKRQTQRTAERIAAALPEARGCVPSIAVKQLTGRWSDADAITWPNGKIELNAFSYADHKAFAQRIAEDVASGWAPQGCDESYVFAHEFGHALDRFLYKKLGYRHESETASAIIQKEIMERCGLTTDSADIRMAVSGYAAGWGPSEWFAEAIGEALCSEHPRPVAAELLKWVKQQLKGTR